MQSYARLLSRHFNFVKQTPCVISNVIDLTTTLLLMPLTFFVFFLPSMRKAYIFVLSLTKSVMIAPLFSSFIKSGTFLLVSGMPITRYRSRNRSYLLMSFHDFEHTVTLNMVNETIRINVHDFTFFVIHVVVIKFVQTCLGHVEATFPRILIC